MPPAVRQIVETIAIAAVYAGTGYVGHLSATSPTAATLVWPPSGIALAAALLLGNRALLGVFFGAAAINALIFASGNLPPHANAAIIGSIASGSALQSYLGALVLNRATDHGNPIGSLVHSLRFAALAPAICLVSASVGAASLMTTDRALASEVGTLWLTWWLGDTLGVLVFTPLVYTIYRKPLAQASVLIGLLVVGIGASILAGATIRKEGENTWARETHLELERLTSDFLLRLDLSYVPVRALSAVFKASDVTHGEFLEVIKELRDNGGRFFPNSIHYATRKLGVRQDESWSIRYTTGTAALGLDPAQPIRYRPLRNAIDAAERTPGKVVIGAVETDSLGRRSALMSMTAGRDELGGVLIAVVDINQIVEDLLADRGVQNLRLWLRAELTHDPERSTGDAVLYSADLSAVGATKPVFLKAASGAAQMVFRWDVPATFLGGPPRTLATIILIGGTLLAVWTAVFVSVLLSHNERVARQVAVRTSQLAVKESELKQKTTILEATLENVAQGITMIDRDLNLVAFNRRATELLDMRSDVFRSGMPLATIFRFNAERGEYGPGDPDEQVRIRIEAAKKFLPHVFERTRPDGTVLEVRGTPLTDGGFVTTYTDITLRKRTEAALAGNERKIRRILETSNQGFWMANNDRITVEINDAMCQILGRRREEILGNSIFEFVDDKNREIFVSQTAKRKRGEADAYEIELQRPDGSLVPCHINATPIVDDDGIKVGSVAMVTDLTARKRAEVELMAAKERAESATRTKSAFLATMSHEIRTPLNGVVGMIDLLAETELNTDQREMMATVRDSAFALLRIINDVLDFSKIEAGRLSLESAPISIRDVIDGVGDTLGSSAKSKGLLLMTFVDPNVPDWVQGDQVRLRQILLNLGSNAVKFCENRDGRRSQVIIRADRLTDGAEGRVPVRFSVVDNGIGISEEVLPTLFKPFTQAEVSTTRRFGGTGLGLSICVHLVKLMGGVVGLESELGEGSTFSVTIPFERSSKASAPTAGDLASLRVLLLCRVPELAQFLDRYLRHWNAETAIHEDVAAAEAFACAASVAGQEFHVAVIDPTFDRQSQEDIRERMRRRPELDGMKFVLLTSGQRKRSRLDLPDSVAIDAIPLRRASFLTAVAVASGRASPEVRQDPSADRTLAPAVPSVEEAEANGQLILVAEDNVTNQDVIRRQLHALGYALDMTADGREALAAWQSKRYAILLTDCHMPEMDGFQLTAAIREAEEGSDTQIPIIAITANALQGEADRCLEAGMDDYLPKPLEMNKLRIMLRKWMPSMPGSSIAAIAALAPLPDATADTSMGAAVGSPPPPIDIEALVQVFGNDLATIEEILQEFVDPAGDNAKEILAAYAARASAGVSAAAHKLKSSARAVGAHELADLCAALEAAGKGEDWQRMTALVEKIGPAMARVAEHIQARRTFGDKYRN